MFESRHPNLISVSCAGRRRPEEIANLAVYLASPEAMGMTGQAISLDGGMVMQ